MSRFKSAAAATGKTAKFVAVSMPLRILGWQSLVEGNQFIRKAFSALNAPNCPHCYRGGMVCDNEHVDDRGGDITLYAWACSNKECDFKLFAPNDSKEVRRIVDALTAQRGSGILNGMDRAERSALIAGHTRTSRILWGLVSLLAIWFVMTIATGGQLTTIIYLLVFTVFVSLHALKASYRAWQVQTGVLFQPGSFKRFVMQEAWIR